MRQLNIDNLKKIQKVLVFKLELFGKNLRTIPPKKVKYLVIITLEFFAVCICLYLLVLPFYPEIIYKIESRKNLQGDEALSLEIDKQMGQTGASNKLPNNKNTELGDRLVIPKIGVNIPIVLSENEEYGLSKGAWMMPSGSTPGKGGNIIISGHRFKYLPPSNMTFYLFHKLEKGNNIEVNWRGEKFFYRVKEIKIVDDSDISILNKTKEETLTMFTCHPIYSTSKRLVIISERIVQAN